MAKSLNGKNGRKKNVKIRKMAIRAKNENITDSNAIKIKYC
jgi:hypothetical protein